MAFCVITENLNDFRDFHDFHDILQIDMEFYLSRQEKNFSSAEKKNKVV